MKLIYLSSSAVQQFCTINPIDWCTRNRAEQADILTPTPGMQVFFDLLLSSNKLFTQAQYYDAARAVWGDWVDRLTPRQQDGIKARLYRNFYPSAMDSIHAWALLVETGLFGACYIDPLDDAKSKTDITVITNDRQSISIALYFGGNYSKLRTEYKRRVRGSANYAIDVVLPPNRPQFPGNKRWYKTEDFADVIRIANGTSTNITGRELAARAIESGKRL